MGTSVVAMVDAKLLGVFTALTSLALIGYHAGVPLQLPGYQQPDSEPTEQKTQSLTYSLIECAPKFGLEDHIPAVQAELARTQAAEIDDAMSINSESALRKMLVEVGASDSASKFEDCSGLRSGYLTMILTAKPKTSSYRKFLKECAKCAATALRADQQPFPTQAMHLDMIEMLSLDWLRSSSYLLEYAQKYKPLISAFSPESSANFRNCMAGTEKEPGAPRNDNAKQSGSRSLLGLTVGDEDGQLVTMRGAISYLTGQKMPTAPTADSTADNSWTSKMGRFIGAATGNTDQSEEVSPAGGSSSSRRLMKGFFSGSSFFSNFFASRPFYTGTYNFFYYSASNGGRCSNDACQTAGYWVGTTVYNTGTFTCPSWCMVSLANPGTCSIRECLNSNGEEEEEVSVACFGTEGDVAAADGASIKISDVKIGDKLHGNDEVWYIHEVKGEHKALRIGTSNGESLVVTPHHLLSTEYNGFSAASSVQVGDSLQGAKGLVQVVSIDTVKAAVRSPITMSGTVMVNGVLASCYGAGTHEAVHQLIAPFRAFSTVAPTVVYDLGKFVADNTIKPVVESMITMQISA